jgi:hypothetical protein
MKEKIAQLVSWIQARTPIQWAAAFAVLITLTAVTVTISSYVRQKNNIETCSTPNCLPASPTPLTLQAATPTPSPKTVPALLDGVGVEPGSDALRPLAVMIENHPEARPQSGLNSASIVYEALAEGGITRFMALYRDARQPVRVGPVRSARVYYVELANEYGAFYAHAGGNSFALALIDQTNTYDIDGLNIGAPQFTRDRSRNVSSEHTLYSSTDLLWDLATKTYNWPSTSTLQSWKFTNQAPLASRGAAQKASIEYSYPLYRAAWQYDAATNQYIRSMADQIHRDANSGEPITTDNVIIQTVERSVLEEKSGTVVWKYQLTGTGPATILKNGTSTNGTWQKNQNGRTRFLDASGTEIELVRGKTWVHLVHPDTPVSVSPN